MQINVETFEAALRARGLKQADVARKARVGAKTIGRIRRGEDLRRSNVEKIAAALNVAVEALLEPPSDKLVKNAAKKSGMERLVIDIPAETLNRLTMTEFYYGVSMRGIIQWAPLFFGLIAEMSLKDRRKKLEDWFKTAMESISRVPGRHVNEVEALKSDLLDLYWEERNSIDRRDLSGGFTKEHSTHNDGGNAFLCFIEDIASSISEDIEFIDATHEEPWFAWYNGVDPLHPGEEQMFHRDAEHGDLAAEAVSWGHVLLRDIPDELLVEDKLAERVRWLASHYGGANGDLEDAYARNHAWIASLGDDSTETDGGDDEQASA
jgi:transcriptional regulator with XRE-family HTH domain